MRGVKNLFLFVLGLLPGMLMAASTAVSENDLSATHEISTDAKAQAAYDEPPEAGSPVKIVAEPRHEDLRCANVVLLDSENFCRYAASQTANAAHPSAR
jgi:hypothetical protein